MKKLKWYELINVNLFWLGLNIRNFSVGNTIMPYLLAGFVVESYRNTALTGLVVIQLVIAMLAQPVFGLLSDRSTSRFGRRRPFIFVGVLLDLVFLTAVVFSWNYVSLLISVMLIQFSMNISHGALQGLIPDLVPEEQRDQAAAIKSIFELLPLILTSIVIAQLLGFGQLYWAAFATGAALLVLMLITMVVVKEEPLKEKPNVPLWPPMVRVLGLLLGIIVGALCGLASGAVIGGLAGLITWLIAGLEIAKVVFFSLGGLVTMVVAVITGVWAGAGSAMGEDPSETGQEFSWRAFWVTFWSLVVNSLRSVNDMLHRKNAFTPQQNSFTWWVVNRLMFLTALFSLQRFAPYFLMSTFHISREAGTAKYGNLIMLVGVFTLISAFLSGWLSHLFGRKRLIAYSGVIAGVGTAVLMVSIWIPNDLIIYAAGMIIGLGVGVFNSLNWAMGTDLVPKAEAGRYLGIQNLAGAGSSMIGMFVGGPMADLINAYQPGLGYFAIFGCYAILFLLSIIFLQWVKKSETQSLPGPSITEA